MSKRYQLVDLSQPIYTGMPHWATHPDPELTKVKWLARDGFDLSIIDRMTVHTGTHIDAPSHFKANGKTISDLSLEKFMGDGIVLDLRGKKASEEISGEDIRTYGDRIKENDVVLLCTGWSKKRGFSKEYLFEWPYVGDSAAHELAKKKIKAVGIDGLSIGGWAENGPSDVPRAETAPIESHLIFLENEIVIIEDLSNLEKVLEGSTNGRARFVFAPLSLSNAEASPCRAFAILELS
jgi:arylformamidase